MTGWTEWCGEEWRLIHGDCLDVLPTLGKCDHVITDPPYEAEAHTLRRRVNIGPVKDGLLKTAPIPFPAIDDGTRELAGSIVADMTGRWALVFCQSQAMRKWESALAPLKHVRDCVWVKLGASPQFSGDRPAMGYENFVLCHTKGRTRWNGGGRSGVFTYTSAARSDFGGKQIHPTTKPLPLMLELVSLFTDPGELIVDPFCGSGTTGVACMRLGRRFIGIEKDAEYADLARRRLEAEQHGSDLRSADAGQVPLFGGDT